MESSAKELVEELNKHKAEVSKLRNILNELNREKESWYKKKGDISAKIRASIQKIKESKLRRDALTKEVKELKPKRDTINKDISSRSSDLDKLRKEKTELARELDVIDSPSKIKDAIEKLEFRIETEAISFEKEKGIMKKIKELKKLYNNSKDVQEVDKAAKNSAGIIRSMRNEAKDAHHSIQEKARHSQLLHEEILKNSAEIDKMRIEEGDCFKKFSEFKKKFNETNAQFKEQLKAMDAIESQLDKINLEKKEKRRQEQESFLKSKEEAVNEKIKRKEKLTTEDLLVFQKFGKE